MSNTHKQSKSGSCAEIKDYNTIFILNKYFKVTYILLEKESCTLILPPKSNPPWY